MCYLYLPPANEVWGKVMFLQVSVILFTGGAWSRRRGCLVPGGGGPGPRGVPGPKGGALSGRGLVPACLAAFQAHTQGGSLGGSGRGGSPGPHPRGKLRGVWSRPTPKGEVEGDLVQAHPPSPWRLLLRPVRILLECILVCGGKNQRQFSLSINAPKHRQSP